MSNADNGYKSFEKMVKLAESYIEDKAKNILLAIRDDNNTNTSCIELIKNKYKPMFDSPQDITFDGILLRFCIQLQNYQAMPKAINFVSYNEDEKNIFTKENTLFKAVKESLDDYLNSPVDKINLKLFGVSKSIAHERYEKSLTSVFEDIAKKEKKEEYTKYIREIAKNIHDSASDIEKINEILKEFYKDIYFLGKTLSYDFFKELCCTNLIKDDVHIKECWKDLVCENDTKDIVPKFIEYSEKLKEETSETSYTPYYIDKIIWLCCTGSFYEDGIIITKMNRQNFIKYCKNKIIVKN